MSEATVGYVRHNGHDPSFLVIANPRRDGNGSGNQFLVI